MLIDYTKESTQVFPHFKGGEKEYLASMFADDRNRIMKGILPPGASIGLHTHETSSEIIFCLSGSGRAVVDGCEERVVPDTCHYCPKGATHTLINDGAEDLVFYAVVPEQ